MQVKLALIGRNISHSQSPQLQKKIWGDMLRAYDLIEVANFSMLPSLLDLSRQYIGINITTPYKESYFDDIQVESDVARAIRAVNTISLTDMSGINTDAIAVEKILLSYLKVIPGLRLHLLGNGVMARMTVVIAQKLGIQLLHYTRQTQGDLSQLDLSELEELDLVINSCSRSFVFTGKISSRCHFWDYNYAFPAHSYLSKQLRSYQDGQSLLLEQAISAAKFWQQKAKINI